MTTADLRSGRIAVTVVIPLEWSGGAAEPYRVEEMARYLDGLRLAVAEVVVVDGSDAPVRREHEQSWGDFVGQCPHAGQRRARLRLARHLRPAPLDAARGGVRYHGRRLCLAAHSSGELRRRPMTR